jgi:energy-coupling factor transporter ATP-binding protein EcfA2
MVCKEDKEPCSIHSNGYPVSAKNPANWCSFVDAYLYAIAHDMWIGFCLSADDPLTCIDFDHYCENKELIDIICAQLNTYFEWSMGGNGLHAWLYGNIGKGRRAANDKGEKFIEVYSQERFIVMTGNVANPVPILDDQEWLQDFVAKIPHSIGTEDIPDQPPIESDAAVWEKLANSKYRNTHKIYITDEWEQKYPDRSDGDFAFASMLAEFTPSNQQIWSIFQQLPIGKRLKNGRVRHPNGKSFLSHTCVNARAQLQNSNIEADVHDRPAFEAAIGPFPIGQIGKSLNGGGNQAQINGFAAPSGESNILQFPQQLKVPTLPFLNQESSRNYIGIDSADILSEPPVEWIVKKVLEKKSVAMVYGHGGSGKSFLMLHLMYALAQGESWFGIKTTQCGSAYIALEGGGAMQERVMAWSGGTGQVPRGIDIIRESFNLCNEAQVKEFIRQRKEAGKIGGLVIIDTLSRATVGNDENDNKEMGVAMDHARQIAVALEACVIIVHHSRKDSTGYRGSSVLYDDADAAIQVENLDGTNKMNIQRVRNGIMGGEYYFVLEDVDIGLDKDGEPNKSKRIKPVDDYGTPMDEVSPGNGGTVEPWKKPFRKPEVGTERKGRPLKYHSFIERAFAMDFARTGGANVGKFGAPAGKNATPRKILDELILEVANPENVDSTVKKAVADAIGYAIRSGKVGHCMQHGKQYLWMM